MYEFRNTTYRNYDAILTGKNRKKLNPAILTIFILHKNSLNSHAALIYLKIMGKDHL